MISSEYQTLLYKAIFFWMAENQVLKLYIPFLPMGNTAKRVSQKRKN